jgi:hypothetical protein
MSAVPARAVLSLLLLVFLCNGGKDPFSFPSLPGAKAECMVPREREVRSGGGGASARVLKRAAPYQSDDQSDETRSPLLRPKPASRPAEAQSGGMCPWYAKETCCTQSNFGPRGELGKGAVEGDDSGSSGDSSDDMSSPSDWGAIPRCGASSGASTDVVVEGCADQLRLWRCRHCTPRYSDYTDRAGRFRMCSEFAEKLYGACRSESIAAAGGGCLKISDGWPTPRAFVQNALNVEFVEMEGDSATRATCFNAAPRRIGPSLLVAAVALATLFRLR